MQTNATQTVLRYLSAMEARDLETARAMLAPGFTMHFPGAATMTTLEELVEWSRPRYSKIGKTYDQTEETTSGAVYVRGMLHGTWNDGTNFSGIRYIDRFELQAGKLTRQDVWNDMAEVKS